MSTATVATLTADAARVLTDEAKEDAEALWGKLLALYEGGAHTALGYSSWGDYCAEEFDMGKSQAYRLLDSGRVIEALGDSPVGERPASESVARELVPVLRESPEEVEEVWAEVVQAHGPKPTAAQTREKVKQRKTAADADQLRQLGGGSERSEVTRRLAEARARESAWADPEAKVRDRLKDRHDAVREDYVIICEQTALSRPAIGEALRKHETELLHLAAAVGKLAWGFER